MNNEQVLNKILKEFSERYSRRVWYTRTAMSNTVEEVQQEEGFEDTPEDILQQMLATKKRYWNEDPEIELCKLEDGGDWNHGFNSGVLAAVRLVQSIVEGEAEEGLDEFPFLDT